MGVTFTIYDRATKKMFDLGKLVRREEDGRGIAFRVSSDDIAEFIARHAQGGDMIILPDTADIPPDTEDGWAEVD